MAGHKKSRIIPAKVAKRDGRANRHRFQGFQERVATLQINPLQKARLEDERQTESFFASRFAYWKEINLSEPFVNFAKEIAPFCDSLAQILHHEQKIIDALVLNLERQDVLYLEPLLDLVSHLAHDLRHRFEKHYARVITAISRIVSCHQDVEVLEWSFNTFAWIFQFLSRYLVPDLRPTFDVLAPLLGKDVKKGHIARFAAEAMSFLMRKAAIRAEREIAPLQLITSHIIQDWMLYCSTNSDTEVYTYGLMTLFSDCIKDIKASRAIRPSGQVVMKLLLEESLAVGSLTIPKGVVVSLIHHTEKETFKPMLETLTSWIQACGQRVDVSNLAGMYSLLDNVIETRKGDRVMVWSSVFSAFQHLITLTLDCKVISSECTTQFTRVSAALIQTAPFEALFPNIDKIMSQIFSTPSLCNCPEFFLFAWDVNQQRFDELLKPYLFRYLADVWDKHDIRMLFTTRKVVGLNPDSFDGASSNRLSYKKWPEQVLSALMSLNEDHNEDLASTNALLDLVNTLPRDVAVSEQIQSQLRHLIKKTLSQSTSTDSQLGRLILGKGLSLYLRRCREMSKPSELEWNALYSVHHAYGRMPLYVENLMTLFDIEPRNTPLEDEGLSLLVSNLATNSASLRKASLRILEKISASNTSTDTKALNIAMQIERTPLDFVSVKTLTSLIRDLATAYATSTNHPWIGKVIIHYCFGLLTFNLTPIWNVAIESLNTFYEQGGTGSQLVEDMVFRWLEEKQADNASKPASSNDQRSQGPITEFQCTNTERQSQAFNQTREHLNDAYNQLRIGFDQEHEQIRPIPDKSASQAIKVLKAIPLLAERRSRRLVPLFLSWASSDEDSEATFTGEVSPENSARKERNTLIGTDKKELLDIFGSIPNPKALYRSGDVYDGLLHLLANGDAAIQKAALKALVTWKKPGLQICKEHFDNLLDNARFREELTMFLPQKLEEKGLTTGQRQEMIQILLPLLFGRVTARGKSAAGKMTQSARRRAVFESLGTFPTQDLIAFVDIALGPLKGVEIIDHLPVLPGYDLSLIPLRRQVGFIRLAKDLLECVGDKLAPCAGTLLNAVMFCFSRLQSVDSTDIGEINDNNRTNGDASEQTNEEVNEEANEDGKSEQALQKVIRQSGFQCLTLMFKHFPLDSLESSLDTIFKNVILPRLGQRFLSENSQSISSLLRLFATWASNEESAKYLTFDEGLLPNLIECLTPSSSEKSKTLVKPQVKIFILDEVLKPLLIASQIPETNLIIRASVLEILLDQLASILESERLRDLMASSMSLTLRLAPVILQTQSSRLATVLGSILILSTNEVRPQTKSEALELLGQCLAFIDPASEAIRNLWAVLSKQFMQLGDPWRLQLTKTFGIMGNIVGSDYQLVSEIVANLNAVVKDRLDEPDMEKRARAFERVLQLSFQSEASDTLWSPLVYNALYHVRDEEETFIRKNASQILRRFVELNCTLETKDDKNYPSSKIIRGVLFPALRRGASERAEIVRVEYVLVMEHLVKFCTNWYEIKDLSSLTASSEDGESFFGGVIHIQQEWRKRSLIKLARVARQGKLGSDNIALFLLPLTEQFVLDRAEETDAHSVAAQAITTISALSLSLDWTQARKTLRRYTTMIKEKPDLEKAVIRLVGVITEAMYSARSPQSADTALAKSMPEQNVLVNDIVDVLLPPLLSFLHHKDENVVSLRVPIAVSAARLICLLPEELLEYKLAPVLTDVCNILRSKAQESRDMSRKTLAEIAALIGPARFSFILKELRIALSRGYQLHVKSYTLHSLLVASNFKPGELDYCLQDIMRILLDDIFGVTGQEKDAEEYTNKAKEVKSSKSMDSSERMAQIITIPHLKEFILPIHSLLLEKLDARSTAKVDELLRRIGSGLQQNESVGSQSSLVFCFQLLQQAKSAAESNASKDGGSLGGTGGQRSQRFEIRIKIARKSSTAVGVSAQQYKLARFSLDLLRVVLHRHESLRTPANLTGFLVPIGDVLLEAQEEVQIAALRLLSSILKIPMKQWSTSVPVYAQTAFNIVLVREQNTNTELSQAAIKLITSILRDRPEIEVKDNQVAKLVHKLIPDLTQPARQGVTFNFLKAVVARNHVSNDIYEAMDATARLLVTYGDANARNQARSIWIQFVLSYEQNEKRFRQTMNFLTQNLTYQYPEGRQSVFEAVHFLLGKLDPGHLQKACSALFKPVLKAMITDDSSTCRDMAVLLLKEIFERADEENYSVFRKHVLDTFSQESSGLQTAALQTYGVIIEANPQKAAKDIPLLQTWLEAILLDAVNGNTDDWKLSYAALQLATKMCDNFKDEMLDAKNSDLWGTIWQLSSYPHAWVKFAAAQLLGSFVKQFDDLDRQPSDDSSTVISKSGLSISKTQVVKLVNAYFGSLWRDLPEWLAKQIVSNLDILEKIAGGWSVPEDEQADDDSSDDDDEETGLTIRCVRELYFLRMSALLRRESSLFSKQASLQLLGSLTNRLSAETLRPSLQEILSALNHMTDKSITRTIQADNVAEEQQQQLTDISHQIMAGLQEKFPDGEFVNAMHQVQQKAKSKRDERRNKRRIEAVADPERASKDKMKRRERGRERKKERNSIHRSRRRGW